jgi:hypothetical protein
MIWIGVTACVVETRVAFRIVIRKPDWMKPLEDIGVDGRIYRNVL